MPHKILIVDDDESIRFVLNKALTKEGYEVTEAKDGVAGLAELKTGGYPLAFMDIRMPGMDGLAVLEKMKDAGVGTYVIMMTAQGTMRTAIEAMKFGAFDYITKPFDVDEVKLLAQRALENRAMAEEVANLKASLRERYEVGAIVGQSHVMQQVFKDVGRVSGTDVTVLITGESGTGKELIARAIHAHSKRVGGPFVVVNSAAIPSELMESELFGHEKGAFTGAAGRKTGKFEQASGGTLFLDEIGDMDINLQAKLLRALQEKEFQRVGGTETIKADARIIAATHRDLDDAVKGGRFREDLYYRLNVVSINLPPLRERKEDIPVLAEHFLDKTALEIGSIKKSISPKAMKRLVEHTWPGNVRELENCLKRAVVLSSSAAILPEDVEVLMKGAQEPASPACDQTLEGFLEERIRCYIKKTGKLGTDDLYASVIALVERPLIISALIETNYNQLKAAELLGINRNTLRKKVAELGIPLLKGNGRPGASPDGKG
ncbi:MAG: sigma-54-dependent Fis family transcriptional regulator [Nitrospirae bacterium]|nr:sigma-54-dependent Fis family transcriptional regulator [Nitrospirota bacterium]